MTIDPRLRRELLVWLSVCAALVLAMVVVGGVTRLTRSGLSIVEWKPITGVLPPLSEADWARELALYRSSPEGRLVNAAMDLDGFRRIFLIEWGHRLLGRLTGLVVLVPFAWFLASRRLRGRRAARIFGIFLLGGLQGLIGWLMVKSGLVDRPHVSHLRLALHLAMAVAIFGLLLWEALEVWASAFPGPATAATAPARVGLLGPLAWFTAGLAFATLVWGGFVAGLHAGHVAPTFPDMNGAFVPKGLTLPGPRALVDDPLLVHFVHRVLAYLTLLASVSLLWQTRRLPEPARAHVRPAALVLVGLITTQILLGAITVLGHVQIVPAVLHQLNGTLVVGAAVAVLHALRIRHRRA